MTEEESRNSADAEDATVALFVMLISLDLTSIDMDDTDVVDPLSLLLRVKPRLSRGEHD